MTRDRYALERTHAPHVDPRWTEALLLELRLQGVPGDRIGAVLAEVDAHCVDSGESAQDAFGDPVAYARALDLPESPAQSARATGRVVLASLVQVVGMLAVVASVRPAVDGTGVTVPLGAVVGLVVLVLALALLAREVDRVLRFVVAHPVLAAAAGAGGAVVVVGTALLVRTPLGDVSALPVLVVGLALLAVGTVQEVRELRDAADPLVPPGAGGSAGTPAGSRWARFLPALLVPVATAVLVVVTLVSGS